MIKASRYPANCSACKFWAARDAAIGECHARAPVLGGTQAVFPLVAAENFCGDYQERPLSAEEWEVLANFDQSLRSALDVDGEVFIDIATRRLIDPASIAHITKKPATLPERQT